MKMSLAPFSTSSRLSESSQNGATVSRINAHVSLFSQAEICFPNKLLVIPPFFLILRMLVFGFLHKIFFLLLIPLIDKLYNFVIAFNAFNFKLECF